MGAGEVDWHDISNIIMMMMIVLETRKMMTMMMMMLRRRRRRWWTPVMVAAALSLALCKQEGGGDDEGAVDKMAQAVVAACRPIDDKRGTIAYRTRVSGVLAGRACRIAFERARAN